MKRRFTLPSDPKDWTRETIIRAIRDLYEQHDRLDRRVRPFGDGADVEYLDGPATPSYGWPRCSPFWNKR